MKSMKNYPACKELNAHIDVSTVVPTKSDSDVLLCLHLLSKALMGTLHLS